MTPPLSSSALGWPTQGTSAAPHTPCPPDPSPSSYPSFGCSLTTLHPYIVVPKATPSTRGEASQRTAQQDNPFPRPMALLGLGHSRAQLAFGRQGTPLNHLTCSQKPQVLFCRAVLQLLIRQSVCI